MRFSIIIPAFNCESYIADAILSAIGQTHRDLEIIVVDDGSTDGTLKQAQAIMDPRLRVMSQENSGVMVARKAGFASCHGNAVVFLDSDDRLRPDTIERYQHGLETQPKVGLLYGDRILMGSKGAVFGSRRGALLNPHPSGDVLRPLLTRNFLSTPGQACIRSECLEHSTALHLNIRRAIDWVLLCEIAASYQFAYVGAGPVVEYRILANSMARNLANTGNHTVNIDEILPAIRAIYVLPGVLDHFRPEHLASLRRMTEGSAYAWKGQEYLRAKQWQAARTYFLKAMRLSRPMDPRDLLCLGLTYLRWFPPGSRRYIGLP
ncbi:MAG: glycosyltransferase family A protein [Candidatus Binatia bacterium]|nr:glycosyltransferase family A protein [Candidatus Binatia bacterium]